MTHGTQPADGRDGVDVAVHGRVETACVGVRFMGDVLGSIEPVYTDLFDFSAVDAGGG